MTGGVLQNFPTYLAGHRMECPVRLAYQPPANSIFLSEQTSNEQPASSTFLSDESASAISHQPNEQAGDPVAVTEVSIV
jgi:hypothetical protein